MDQDDFKKKVIISDKLLNQRLDLIVKQVLNYFHNIPTKIWAPILHLFTCNDSGEPSEAIILLDNPADEKEKYQAVQQAGYEMGRRKVLVTTVFFIGEAWKREIDPNDPDGRKNWRDAPIKEEIVFVSGITVDGRICAAQIPVMRDEQEHIVLPTKRIHRIPYSREQDKIESDLLTIFIQSYLRAFVGQTS